MAQLPQFDLPELKRRMQAAHATLKHELGGLRTGRASASLLEPVQVDAYGQRIVSTIFSQLSQYRVILEVEPEFSASPANFNDIYLQSANGTPVPMSAVVQVAETTTALSIERQGQFPASMISFNLAPGTSLLKAIGAINDEVKKSGLPASVTPSFQGTPMRCNRRSATSSFSFSPRCWPCISCSGFFTKAISTR